MIINENNSWSGHEKNHTFLNQGGGNFVDVSRLSGTDTDGDGRSVALVDWDDDGSLDLILRSRSAPRVQVFHNRYGKPGNFIAFELRGNGTSTNRDAIGSRITVQAAGKRIVRALRAGEGFLAQSSKRVHFGLGAAESVESVAVRWADGSESRFEDLQPGKRYRITQGADSGGLEEIPARHVDFGGLPSVTTESLGHAKRAVLAYPLPLAELPVPSFENPKRKVRDLVGSPVLLNLWQVECAGCTIEFGEFRDRRKQIEDAGLRIVTLNADADKDQSLDAVHSRLKLFELHNSDAGYIGNLLPEVMLSLERHIYGEAAVSGEVIMPTSWLLDSKGQLLAIYRGAIQMEQLFADLEAIQSGDELQVMNRLSKGIRLANQKRKLFELANTFQDQASKTTGALGEAFGQMAKFYFAEDELQRGFILQNGEHKPMKDLRYDGPRKSAEQQALEQAASGLDQ